VVTRTKTLAELTSLTPRVLNGWVRAGILHSFAGMFTEHETRVALVLTQLYRVGISREVLHRAAHTLRSHKNWADCSLLIADQEAKIVHMDDLEYLPAELAPGVVALVLFLGGREFPQVSDLV
jgi:hypothetical protein